MGTNKIDNSPFISKMENFEISDKKNNDCKNELKNVYRNLDNEFNFDEEKGEGNKNDEEEEQDQKQEDKEKQSSFKNNFKSNNKQDMKIKTIKIDRKKLKKMFSSQFFTQTLTDSSSTESVREIKTNKKYMFMEIIKMLSIMILFFISSYFALCYIFNYFMGQHNICVNLDLYNYKYENNVHFIPSIRKFPFDVITHKLRKDILKKSMNEEIVKYNNENPKNSIDLISNLNDDVIQIISFNRSDNQPKCEKKIFDLYKPFYLKTVSADVNINNFNFLLNDINYKFITNPYNIPEHKSLKDDDYIVESHSTLLNNNSNVVVNDKIENVLNNDTTNKIIDLENSKKNSLRGEGNVQIDKINNYENSVKYTPKKIIFLYDHYDNNFADLIISIYNMQYSNLYTDLKEYWENIKAKFKVLLWYKLQHNTEQ
ncbi:conserved protein, unknown function [Hepatocystis sp. ex Piliocolobus tephrosceles]|nr:conserved protein, unknown function [Hepatocystis sp. ex Piliocolobus tephrosceles]